MSEMLLPIRAIKKGRLARKDEDSIGGGPIPPCGSNFMTVLPTVVTKSRKPYTVLVVRESWGREPSLYTGLTLMASGSPRETVAAIRQVSACHKRR